MTIDSFTSGWNTNVLFAHNIPSIHDYIAPDVNKNFFKLGMLISLGTYFASGKTLDKVIAELDALSQYPYSVIYVDSGGFQYIKGVLKKKDVDKHVRFYFDFVDYLVKQYNDNKINIPTFVFSLDIPGCRVSSDPEVVDNDYGFDRSYEIYQEIAKRYREDQLQRQLIISVLHFSTKAVYTKWKKIYSLPDLNLAQYVAGSSTYHMHKRTVPLAGYNVMHMLALKLHGFNSIKLYHILGTRSLDRIYPLWDTSKLFNIKITHDNTPNVYYRDIIFPVYLPNRNKFKVSKIDIRSYRLQILKSVEMIYQDETVIETVNTILDQMFTIDDKEKLKRRNIKASSLNFMAAMEAITTAMVNKVLDNIVNDLYVEYNIDKVSQQKLIELYDKDPLECERLIMSVLDKFV